MSGTEEHIDVELPLEANEKTQDKNEPIVEVIGEDDEVIARHGDDSGNDEGDDVQKQLKKLQQKLEKEKEARKEAEERARQAQNQLQNAYGEVEDTNLQLVNSAIETVRRDNEILKSHYKEAMSVGDYDRAAELQETMSGNQAKLLQLENGKTAMQTKPRQMNSDPVEQFASQLSQRSAEWVRKNPQCVTDPRLQQKMVAAHNLAVADGYQPDTDDYFGFIEDTLRLNRREKVQDRQEQESPLSSASKPSSRQAPPPAAPANQGGSTRPNVVRLTAAEAETARMFGMTEQEYAKNKIALQKEGKLGR
jgi:hypothetical protein